MSQKEHGGARARTSPKLLDEPRGWFRHRVRSASQSCHHSGEARSETVLPFLGSEVGGEADGSEVGVGTRARAIAARCAERGALSEHYDFRPDVDYTLLRSKVTKATIYRHDPHQRLHHCTPSVAASLGLHHRRQTRHSTLVACLATRSRRGKKAKCVARNSAKCRYFCTRGSSTLVRTRRADAFIPEDAQESSRRELRAREGRRLPRQRQEH